GLSKASARILCDNAASIRVHEKLGFVRKTEETLSIVPGGESVKALFMMCDLNKNINIQEA
ncbi:MAG: GNAT family N-acetyltransferase, partial [Lachnospiraceae bacterium]|nr:GNAT family N-acetyltransferase [Lachnospiraceae bacterium]